MAVDCFCAGSGQVLLTDKVYKLLDGKEYKHRESAACLMCSDNPRDGFFAEGHDVCVEIDLKNLIGRIWNESMNKDGADNEKVFEIMLPSNYEICIVAYMGGSAKKRLFVKDQKFVFDEE